MLKFQSATKCAPNPDGLVTVVLSLVSLQLFLLLFSPCLVLNIVNEEKYLDLQ